ncbi:hypothetical protein V2J09_019448 [Rumex salicifolius]
MTTTPPPPFAIPPARACLSTQQKAASVGKQRKKEDKRVWCLKGSPPHARRQPVGQMNGEGWAHVTGRCPHSRALHGPYAL